MHHALFLAPYAHHTLILLGAVIQLVTIALMVFPTIRIRWINRKIMIFKQHHDQLYRIAESAPTLADLSGQR